MKRKRFTEEQIAFALRQHESGTPVLDVVRKMGITEQTFYRWKKKYAGLGVAEVRRLRQLEDENKKLKQLARKSALTYKAKNNSILVLEDFNIETPKTKEIVNICQNLNLIDKKSVFVLGEPNKNIYLSSRNLQKQKVLTASSINTYEIMNANALVLVESSIDVLNKMFHIA